MKYHFPTNKQLQTKFKELNQCKMFTKLILILIGMIVKLSRWQVKHGGQYFSMLS